MKVLALSGGVGGAKLSYGLYNTLPEQSLAVMVNTADDFVHWGLNISPDVDTLIYTLSERNNTQQGWGLEGETWQCLETMKLLGQEGWFMLGDKDLATHLFRTQQLASGKTLTDVTKALAKHNGLACEILPMCDQTVATHVTLADGGELGFQAYFVKEQCQPAITDYYFEGIDKAICSEELKQAIQSTEAIIICPSNPFVSVKPLLSVSGVTEAIEQRENLAVAAVSPIVGGQAIKGPAAKMMAELGMPVNALEVARFYQGLVTHFVLDSVDAVLEEDICKLGMNVLVTNTIMKTNDDKKALAREVLAFIQKDLAL